MNKLQQYRDKLFIKIVDLSKPIYAKLFHRKKLAWDYDYYSLRKFPTNTLAYDLACFLKKEELELMPTFESHDVYHVLLDYKTTVTDEAKMQFFLLGNKKFSLYIISTVLIALCFMPEHWKKFTAEFRKGSRCQKVGDWDFLYLLREPTALLKAQVFNENYSSKPFRF